MNLCPNNLVSNMRRNELRGGHYSEIVCSNWNRKLEDTMTNPEPASRKRNSGEIGAPSPTAPWSRGPQPPARDGHLPSDQHSPRLDIKCTRNAAHSNHPQTIPIARSMEERSSAKPVPGAEKAGDHWRKDPHHGCPSPSSSRRADRDAPPADARAGSHLGCCGW